MKNIRLYEYKVGGSSNSFELTILSFKIIDIFFVRFKI